MGDLLPPWLRVGALVRVVATGAMGEVVEVSIRRRSADVDLGGGVVAELAWNDLAPEGWEGSGSELKN